MRYTICQHRRSKTLGGPWTRNSEGAPNQWVHFGWGLPGSSGPLALSTLSTHVCRDITISNNVLPKLKAYLVLIFYYRDAFTFFVFFYMSIHTIVTSFCNYIIFAIAFPGICRELVNVMLKRIFFLNLEEKKK